MRLAWFTPLPTNDLLKSALTTVAVLDGVRRRASADGTSPVEIELFTSGDELRLFEHDARGGKGGSTEGAALPLAGLTISLRRAGSRAAAPAEARTASPIELRIADGGAPHGSFPLYHFLRAFERHRSRPFDLFVFQLEDSPRVEFVTSPLAIYSGVLYLHDLNLNRLVLSRFEHSTGGTDLRADAEARFGKSAPPFGSWHVRGWSFDAFDRSYLRGAEHHADGALRFVAAEGFIPLVVGDGTPGTVRYLAPPALPPVGSDTETAERSAAPYVLYDGAPEPRSRARKVLEGIARAREQGAAHRLYWILEDERARDAAKKLLAAFGLEEGGTAAVELFVAPSRAEREELLRSAALVLAPLFDPARSPSVLATEARSYAVPVALSAGFGPASGRSGHSIVLPTGEEEGSAIAAAITAIADTPLTSAPAAEAEHEGERFLRELVAAARSEQHRLSASAAEREQRFAASAEQLLENVRRREAALSLWPGASRANSDTLFAGLGWEAHRHSTVPVNGSGGHTTAHGTKGAL